MKGKFNLLKKKNKNRNIIKLIKHIDEAERALEANHKERV